MIDGNLALQPQFFPTIINYPAVNPLEAKGWNKTSFGQYRSNGQIKDKEGFDLYIRRRNLSAFIDDYSKKSSSDGSTKPRENWASEAGSSLPMGNPEPKLTPSACDGGDCLRLVCRRQ
jgi:hypothetical protein